MNLTGTAVLGDTDTTPDQRRRAALYVVAHVTDTADARLVLDMLGLLGGE